MDLKIIQDIIGPTSQLDLDWSLWISLTSYQSICEAEKLWLRSFVKNTWCLITLCGLKDTCTDSCKTFNKKYCHRLIYYNPIHMKLVMLPCLPWGRRTQMQEFQTKRVVTKSRNFGRKLGRSALSRSPSSRQCKIHSQPCEQRHHSFAGQGPMNFWLFVWKHKGFRKRELCYMRQPLSGNTAPVRGTSNP